MLLVSLQHDSFLRTCFKSRLNFCRRCNKDVKKKQKIPDKEIFGDFLTLTRTNRFKPWPRSQFGLIWGKYEINRQNIKRHPWFVLFYPGDFGLFWLILVYQGWSWLILVDFEWYWVILVDINRSDTSNYGTINKFHF